MPPLPPIPGVAKIIVKQTMASVNVFNVLHARNAGGQAWSGSECATLAAAVRSAWVSNFIPLQTSSLTLNDVTAIDLTSNTGAEGSATGSTAGSQAGSTLSSNAAGCVTWKIARRYRGGHPRTYIAGFIFSQTSNPNTWSATHVTNVTNAATALRTAINGLTVAGGAVSMVVPHYVVGGVRLTNPDWSIITGLVVDTRIDSQRRRLGRDR